jgi:hypothetical protein
MLISLAPVEALSLAVTATGRGKAGKEGRRVKGDGMGRTLDLLLDNEIG